MVFFGIIVGLIFMAINLFTAWLDCIAWGWFIEPVLHIATPTVVLMYGFQMVLSLIFGISAGTRIYEMAEKTIGDASQRLGVGAAPLEKYKPLAVMTLGMLYSLFMYACCMPILYIAHLFV